MTNKYWSSNSCTSVKKLACKSLTRELLLDFYIYKFREKVTRSDFNQLLIWDLAPQVLVMLSWQRYPRQLLLVWFKSLLFRREKKKKKIRFRPNSKSIKCWTLSWIKSLMPASSSCREFNQNPNLWETKQIEKTQAKENNYTHKAIFTWFGNLLTSTEL